MKFKSLLLASSLTLSPIALVAKKAPINPIFKNHSHLMDQVFDYFQEITAEGKISEEKNSKFFSPDFQMITNGEVVVNGRDHLVEHFNQVLSKYESLDFTVFEKIDAQDKVVMRYNLNTKNDQVIQVIAIFKIKDGKIYEMNEIVDHH
jgi:predicted SnoaL-like aldol condensation-catalyzing enzyme